MTAMTTIRTQIQNDLLGEFLRALEQAKQDIVKLATAYKACVDSGMDMSRYGKGLGFRLLKIAEGKLLPEVHDKLLGNDAMVASLVTLPAEVQQTLLTHGVAVRRNDKDVVVPIEDVRPSEAKQLVDVIAGRGRLLTPAEQAARRAPIAPRHDKLVELRFTPEEYKLVQYEANKAHKSVTHYLKQQLYLAGVLKK